jgi:uncharacterized protein with HEPN domain
MLNKDQHCLEAIIEASERIIEYTSGLKSADELDNDYKSFDAAMMNFVIIGEMVEKLSQEFKNNHPEIEWLKIKGFRNIVAHDYFGIDAEEVWQIIRDKIPELKFNVGCLLNK